MLFMTLRLMIVSIFCVVMSSNIFRVDMITDFSNQITKTNELCQSYTKEKIIDNECDRYVFEHEHESQLGCSISCTIKASDIQRNFTFKNGAAAGNTVKVEVGVNRRNTIELNNEWIDYKRRSGILNLSQNLSWKLKESLRRYNHESLAEHINSLDRSYIPGYNYSRQENKYAIVRWYKELNTGYSHLLKEKLITDVDYSNIETKDLYRYSLINKRVQKDNTILLDNNEQLGEVKKIISGYTRFRDLELHSNGIKQFKRSLYLIRNKFEEDVDPVIPCKHTIYTSLSKDVMAMDIRKPYLSNYQKSRGLKSLSLKFNKHHLLNC